MKLDKNNNPDFRAHLGRHGHNLSHDFSFTSSTGHLLTVFSELMYPKDSIRGNVQMFTRTQPLLMPANVEIDEYIDYFFVPLDMLYSAFGDYLYQVNEPYSQLVKDIVSSKLPVVSFSDISEGDYIENLWTRDSTTNNICWSTNRDVYGMDLIFLSFYRNFFHNGLNPNWLFSYIKQQDVNSADHVYPFDCFQPNILPLPLLAYNAVYEHYYRIDERELFNPLLYNIDHYCYVDEILFDGNYDEFFTLKYHPRNRDYFTSRSVVPFFNGMNNLVSSGSSLKNINNYLSSRHITLVDAQDNSVSLENSTQVAIERSNYTVSGALRSMFAVEKLLSITSRTKKTYDAQVLAHLGVEVPVDVKHEIQYVGTQHGVLKIGEVVSTAGTTDTPLGDIAGKGYGTLDNKVINFTAPVHGVFIGIYSAVPKYRYYVGLEKRNMITDRLDFFTPEYEKLGMQPIYFYELVASDYTDNQNSVVGWQMRYEQYKRRFNKISPAFINTIINGNEGAPWLAEETFNNWRSWVLGRRPTEYPTTYYMQNDLRNFLVTPCDLNGLMAVDYFDQYQWQDKWNNDPNFFMFSENLSTPVADRQNMVWNVAQLFYRDPLLHFAKCDFKVVNKMQDNTLPDFVD